MRYRDDNTDENAFLIEQAFGAYNHLLNVQNTEDVTAMELAKMYMMYASAGNFGSSLN